jgi:hypothetical protein
MLSHPAHFRTIFLGTSAAATSLDFAKLFLSFLNMLLYVAVTLVVLLALAWKFWPVGEIFGHKVYLGDLLNSNTRLQLQLKRVKTALAKCLNLAPKERLAELLKLENRYGDVFLAGGDIRKAIIGTGVSEATRHFHRILNSPHGALSLSAGLRDALDSGYAEEDFKVQAFKFLVDGLDQNLLGVCRDRVPGLLLRLDKEWAFRVLRGSEYMNPSHDMFGTILEALLEHGSDLPREQIETWLTHYRGRSLEDGEGHEFIQVIKALHSQDSDLAEGLLKEEVDRMSGMSVEAAETLLLIHDLPHPVFSLSDLEEKIGLEALTPSEKTVRLVTQYNYFMSLEGLSRFDWDEPTHRIKEMCVALKEVGCPKHATRLEAYLALYGSEGPPATASERSKIVENACETWQAAVESLYQQHDKLEHAELMALRFELNHSDQFRKRSEIRELLSK